MAENNRPVEVDDFDGLDPYGTEVDVNAPVVEQSQETTQEEVQQTEPPAVEQEVEAATEEEVEEKPQETKEDSEKSDTNEGQEVDPFEDVEIDGETQSLSDELGELAKMINPEIDSKEGLMLELTKLKSQSEQSETTYADENLAEFVNQLGEISKNGGDWKSYYSKEQEIKFKNDKVKMIDDRINALRNRRKGSIAALKDLLVEHEENQLTDENGKYEGPEGYLDDFRESLDGQDEVSIRREALRIANEAINAYGRQKSDIETALTKDKEAQSKAVETAKKVRAEFQTKVRASITSYEDKVSPKYNEPIKKFAANAWNTGDVNVTIPKGVADALLLGEDGKISPEKVIASLGKVAYSEDQINHLKKKVSVDKFRELQDVRETNAPRTAEVGSNEGVDDFDGLDIPKGYKQEYY